MERGVMDTDGLQELKQGVAQRVRELQRQLELESSRHSGVVEGLFGRAGIGDQKRTRKRPREGANSATGLHQELQQALQAAVALLRTDASFRSLLLAPAEYSHPQNH